MISNKILYNGILASVGEIGSIPKYFSMGKSQKLNLQNNKKQTIMKKSMIAMIIAFSLAAVSCGGTKEGEAVKVEAAEETEQEFAEELEVKATDAITEVEEVSIK